MTTTRGAEHSRRWRRAVAAVAVAAGALAVVPARAAAPADGPLTTGRFPEVGRVPLLHGPELVGNPAASGWLILDPATRRGYQVFETAVPARTILQSFDLDTLEPRRRAVLAGNPITSGVADVTGGGTTQNAGEIVHAVDRERGILYLALNQPAAPDALAVRPLGTGGPPDSQRPQTRLVAVDERAFDEGSPRFAASFREPAEQARLHPYWLLGLAVSRHHVGDGERGRLLALFAMPVGAPGAYDHTLAQWDPSGLTFDDEGAAGSGGEDPTRMQLVDAAGPARWLEACAGAPVATAGGTRQGNYQWGLLATRDAVWTACQAANAAGIVARAGLDEHGFLAPAGQEAFRLSQKVSDVLVDEGGERLLVRSWGGGNTWWVFDTRSRRFTGAVAAKSSDDFSLAAGIDPTTGRLYQLTQDYAAGGVPVRGGFGYSDTRLDPAPSLENAAPALAYPAAFAIRVDPVTRRVFVRRGHPAFSTTPTYPGTQDTTPAPAENFYRVLLDNVAVTEAPPAPDDGAFTTDTAESGLTRAAYLGSGSGYGTRALLVGGVQAAAAGAPVCGRDDRELLAGSVRGVEVSDIATVGDAASLDADARTRDDLNNGRCVPGEEAAFDDAAHQGENLYRATCTGDGADTATAPAGSLPARGHVLSRDRFSAHATCEHSRGRAEGASEGAFAVPEADGAQDGIRDTLPPEHRSRVPGDHLSVGYSSSNVSVTRTPGRGVTVKVDAVVREVDVPGVGTIGAVRATATVTASGRRGGAHATYSRTVCDVDFGELRFSNCVEETDRANLEARMNEAAGGRARIRFRDPDPKLLAGSASGYKAGVQRPAGDGFEDARIARDTSPALAAMEVVLYNGDGDGGAARQFLHLAGVYANASYGIACLYGQKADGRCADADEQSGLGSDIDGGGLAADTSGGGPEYVTVTEPGETVLVPGLAGTSGGRSLLERVLRAPLQIAAGVWRLVTSSPAQAALLAAVWALGYGPCRLAARRRRLESVRARRAAWGAAA